MTIDKPSKQWKPCCLKYFEHGHKLSLLLTGGFDKLDGTENIQLEDKITME